MPKNSPSTHAAAPAVEIPDFDKSKAVEMKPAYRHEPTARTVGYEQDLGDGRKALFSATFQFIAAEGAPAPALEPPCNA